MTNGQSDTVIDVRHVGLTYRTDSGDVEALRDISLAVRQNEILTIVGRSGCGKSSLLGTLAGLNRPTVGEVFFGERLLDGPQPEIGYVTQQDNLLPWRTVEGNVSLALELRGVDRTTRRREVAKFIELVGLRGFEKHRPSELSGGMRKRVTLARTLIYQPSVLLLDEPFGSLDAQLKATLQEELLGIWAELKCTFIFVTHDLEEAILLGDRVVLLSSHPGQLRLVENVNIDRPRRLEKVRFSAGFQKLYTTLMSELKTSNAHREDETATAERATIAH